MKISHVTTRAYRIPPNPPWEDATNKVDGIEFIVVEVHTDSAATGIGHGIVFNSSALKSYEIDPAKLRASFSGGSK